MKSVSDEITPLLRAGTDHTVHSALTELNDLVDGIEQFYCVVLMKDGRWWPVVVGDNMGLTFASLILTQRAAKSL